MSHNGSSYELCVAPSLLQGAGKGLFLVTGARPVGGDNWIITEYKGKIVATESLVTKVSSEYAVMRSSDGCSIDGRGQENAPPEHRSFAHFANENFNIPIDKHNAFLADGHDKVYIKSQHMFPAHTITELYLFYGHEYWVFPPQGNTEDPVRWSFLPTKAKEQYVQTHRDALNDFKSKCILPQPVMMFMRSMHVVKKARAAKAAKRAKQLAAVARMNNANAEMKK
jgi:hypothetical protein